MAEGAKCASCGIEYGYSPHGQLDLRLKRPKKCQLEFELETPLLPETGFDFSPLGMNPSPEVDFTGVKVPWHLSQDKMSYFPKAKKFGSLMLDLGCGDTVHREVCEHAGFEYVGIDYSTPEAPILGDGHALPFKDASFEFTLSIAVLEHIRYPFVLTREAYRVLEPGGKFIGTVAYLEPFHGDSFYHHTHLGVFNSLKYGGFTLEKVSPSTTYSALLAQARMGLFPKMPKVLCKTLIWPLEVLHRLWWLAGGMLDGKANERNRLYRTVGAYTFVARKDAT